MTGANLIPDLFSPTVVKKASRDGFGKALVELAEKDPNVWAVTADVSESTRTHWFAEKFPDRFVQVGVAEQNLAGVAAGIAACDKLVFISAFAAFSPGRNFDQIRVSICYNGSNVKIHASHAGVSVGPDGASHQILEDIAMMRALPEMVVVVPADMEEARKATLAAAKLDKPVYIRTSRENTPVFTTQQTPFTIGKAIVCREGKDIVIFACGLQVYESLKAAEELSKKKIEAAVINLHTIKPIDIETIVKYAKQCNVVLSAEDHQIAGGMGSAIAEVLCEHCPTSMKRVGMHSQFAESGNCSELYKKYGLDAAGIEKVALELFKSK
ncbi:1-deoxy-D-xylulose-5-phosphate synthase [Candidatus Bilamarchaeum dharawalense]|uniref:1-deoxy-D-xylulose-5-phosphate synthase n=1 Tax=Candidatus Bilamarchaeum dharawalense TaxID=2885759 RepID=A0A5E4LR44_9ARCH|nr:1-deoxy-D-xylulose-5-phosphate synthase [Candidatus Bilamarchaeum dharawalense]